MDDVLLAEFKAEADEHLVDLEEGFLGLEADSSRPDPDLVDHLFRAAHSLKGGSAFLGLDHISDLAHAMEHLLSLVRNKELLPERPHIDALLAGVDLLKAMVGEPGNPAPPQTEEVKQRLEQVITGPAPSPPQEVPAQSLPEEDDPYPSTMPPGAALPPDRSPTDTAASPIPSTSSRIAKPSGPTDLDAMLLMEFQAEAEDHIADMEESFLALEAQGLDPDPVLAEKVYRAANSIKGGAAFAGLSAIEDLAHAMESLISTVRSGLVTRSAHADALLAGMDLLKTMIAEPTQSHGVVAGPVIDELKRLLSTPQEATTPLDTVMARQSEATSQDSASLPAANQPVPRPVEPPPPASLPLEVPATVQPLSRTEPGDQELEHHAYIYSLNIDLSRLAPSLTPSELFARLDGNGSVLKASLDLNTDPQDGVGHSLGTLTLTATWAANLSPRQAADLTGLLPEDFVIEQGTRMEAPVQEPAPPADPPVPQETRAVEAPAHIDRSGTVRLNVALLDKLMGLAGELVLVRNQQLITIKTAKLVDREAERSLRDIMQRLDIVTTELQETIMRTRMQPIGNVLGKLPRIVRDLAARLRKRIRLTISGSEVELDKTILESLTDPLTHIIRNCCDHGLEPLAERESQGKPPDGRLKVKAFHEGGQIIIEIKDDGRGMDPADLRANAVARGLKSEAELAQMSDREILGLIMLPGFSTLDTVSEVSGRGVGMDVVKHAIEELGGSLEVDSWPGQGSTFTLRLPLTLAIIPCLIVSVGNHRFAVPQVNLEELVTLYDDEVFTRIEVAGNQEVFRLRDRLLPLVRLPEILARPKPFSREVKAEIAEHYRLANQNMRHALAMAKLKDSEADPLTDSLHFAVVKVGAERFGLIVDQILGTEEIVVKPMHSGLKWLKCYSGATVMGDGSVALILDIEGVAQHAGVFLDVKKDDKHLAPATSSAFDTQSVLLFKNGPDELFSLALPLIRRIEKMPISQVDRIGPKEFITIEGVSTRILRLEHLLTVSAPEMREEMFLILPKFAPKPFGILMREIVDIVERPISLNTDSYTEDGLLGTDVIDGRITLFPDIYRLAEKAEPEWFQDRGRLDPPGKVLLIEDSPFMRHMVRRFLEADGYQVLDAENGKDALDILAGNEFDAVVSDIEMPVMDGLDFIRTVRAKHRRPDIPAMALTALKSDKDRNNALTSGFDEYHIKIDREGFLEMVAGLVETGRRKLGGRPHGY